MFITRTVTKKILETIVHETFLKFGNISSSSLLDSLKFLGFYYATNAGISINIEDLKTPNVKQKFLETATEEMSFVSKQWEQGFVSDTERFQSIIDSWNIATESLKNRIIDYYQNFDPANNLYIMAFSGARGNMSQVRQLVGMRGLMSDQEGKIIDLPIQTNFREGLSSIDYIISSYGARKGIVDTALKTADSGYLTRRLIYVAQDLIIREIDCGTKIGVIILFNEKTNFKNILGRVLISAKNLNQKSIENYQNILLTEDSLKNLQKKESTILNIRSPLICKSSGSVCQNCYGWDLAQNKLISLGEAVGIVAAQSIGEPGTQLTMRTFHTGGIFTSEMLQQTFAPFSGRLEISPSLKTVAYRTNHGIIVAKLQQEATITIVNWNGVRKNISLEIGSFLYILGSGFIKKGQLISEYSSRSSVSGARRLKPIYTSIAGEIRFESLLLRYISREYKPKVKVNQDDGILWLTSGEIFPFSKEVLFPFPKRLSKQKAFASFKIITPYEGILFFKDNTFFLVNDEYKRKVDFSHLAKNFKNCKTQLAILPKNYQFVDKHTTIGILYIFPKREGKIYAVRKKDSNFNTTYFLITESDVWKVNSEQINNFSFFADNKGIRAGNFFNETSKFSQSGFLLKKDGFKLLFQKAIPIFLSRGTILNYKQGDFVFEKQLLATLVNYTQQTEDIVQGLPKIEELIEARIPKLKAQLALRSGIYISPTFCQKLKNSKIEKDLIICAYDRINLLDNNYTSQEKAELLTEDLDRKKQTIEIIHSLYNNNRDIIFFDNNIWKIIPLPPDFVPFKQRNKDTFCFHNRQSKELVIHRNGEKISSGWIRKLKKNKETILYKYHKGQFFEWKKIDESNFIFANSKTEDCIIKTKKKEYFFLESLNPITKYMLPLSIKVALKPGTFIDIGEPITEGNINPHELLSILFNYHSILDGLLIGSLRSLNKFQLLLVNSVQSIYQSQGVNISSKHIEIIIRQMTAKVIIKQSGDTPLIAGELIRLSLIVEIYKALQSKEKRKNYKTPKYEPLFLSTTNSSLSKDGFLSAAGFQETKRVLTKAAIEGNSDWLRGLKECVIIGRLIPAGSAFFNYKNYLDNIYLFKD
jgi:hypothetical protein